MSVISYSHATAVPPPPSDLCPCYWACRWPRDALARLQGGKTAKQLWSGVPPYWEIMGHPPTETTTDLYTKFQACKVSAYLSRKQVVDLVAPHLDLVNSWLDIIDALYQHVEMNETVLRTLSYSLPDTFHGYEPSRRRRTSALYTRNRRTRAFGPVG
ncbi:hypothetical protein EDB89DRAFT_2065872 [Lactarius sanguifluus]|nr:hypothetical protein EDB89DRAFT_2065872 [Lactarius sanguifluus]